MNTPNFSILLLLAVACSLGVTGCKKTPKSPTPIFPKGNTAPRGDGTPSPLEPSGPIVPLPSDPGAVRIPGAGDGQNDLGPREELGEFFLDRDVFKQQTVYFDYDRFNLKAGEVSKAQSVASHLQGQPTVKVL